MCPRRLVAVFLATAATTTATLPGQRFLIRSFSCVDAIAKTGADRAQGRKHGHPCVSFVHSYSCLFSLVSISISVAQIRASV